MKGQTSKGFRIILLVFAIYLLAYGLIHVISPELVGAIDPPIERMFGATVVAIALGAGLAYLEKTWSNVRIVVLTLTIWVVLYTLGMAWGILSGGITTAAWPPTIIAAILSVLFIIFYIREQKRNR
jgi:lipoprotein signal peptidase